MRLTPLGPMPRSDTPCAVGCDDRLLVRRNRLKVGICRSTSSATTAGDWRMSWRLSTLTLAGRSPVRCSLRVAVTVTVSDTLGRREHDVDLAGRAVGADGLARFGKAAGAHDQHGLAGADANQREACRRQPS